MPDTSDNEHAQTIREVLGLPHLFRSLGFAVRGVSLAAAFFGLCATLFYGGCVLDPIAHMLGTPTLSPVAVEQFAAADATGTTFKEPTGEFGIFEVFRRYEQRAILDLLSAPIPGAMQAAPHYGDVGVVSRLAVGLVEVGHGLWWLIRCHFLYFLFLAAGTLLIWSFCGGAICRTTAVQFARDEHITIARAFDFAREHLTSGFFLAPCLPLMLMAVFALIMILCGVGLRIPVFGDLLGGLGFFLTILLGFGITLLGVGTLAGGSLFWPGVAIERCDWFDAFNNGLQYPLARPWKALWYAIVTAVFGAFCWFFVRWFTYFVLAITRGLVAFGTSPWGLWNRGTEADPISKLAMLWPMSGPDAMYHWPAWSGMSWYECVSGFLIGLCVLAVLGLMWSFLITFYFSGSTVIYFLLRRDVDGTDLQDLRDDVDASASAAGAPVSPQDERTNEAQPDPPSAPRAT